LAQTQDQVEKALKYTTELLDDGREEKFRFVDINPEYAEWYNAIPHDKGLSMNKLY
jgi:hypothetical protein